jgi:hypothetical protein
MCLYCQKEKLCCAHKAVTMSEDLQLSKEFDAVNYIMNLLI